MSGMHHNPFFAPSFFRLFRVKMGREVHFSAWRLDRKNMFSVAHFPSVRNATQKKGMLRHFFCTLDSLLKLVQEGRNRVEVFAIGNDFPFEFDARVGAELAFEVFAEHLLALRAVPEADTELVFLRSQDWWCDRADESHCHSDGQQCWKNPPATHCWGVREITKDAKLDIWSWFVGRFSGWRGSKTGHKDWLRGRCQKLW